LNKEGLWAKAAHASHKYLRSFLKYGLAGCNPYKLFKIVIFVSQLEINK